MADIRFLLMAGENGTGGALCVYVGERAKRTSSPSFCPLCSFTSSPSYSSETKLTFRRRGKRYHFIRMSSWSPHLTRTMEPLRKDDHFAAHANYHRGFAVNDASNIHLAHARPLLSLCFVFVSIWSLRMAISLHCHRHFYRTCGALSFAQRQSDSFQTKKLSSAYHNGLVGP